jgi:hypothetical protein
VFLLKFLGFGRYRCTCAPIDCLGLSILFQVDPHLVAISEGNRMPAVECSLFPIIPNNYLNFFALLTVYQL